MRSGAFSRAEPRSSTKGVLTGAGRASLSRIQALSTAAGGAAAAAIVAGSSAASIHACQRRYGLRAGPGVGIGGIGRHRVLRSSALLTVAPEIVEIEPVERRIAHVMFEPRDVTRDERGHRRRALAPRDGQAVAEVLEHQIVA